MHNIINIFKNLMNKIITIIACIGYKCTQYQFILQQIQNAILLELIIGIFVIIKVKSREKRPLKLLFKTTELNQTRNR